MNGSNSSGKLQINVTSEINGYPVEGANIRISYTGIPDQTLEEVSTDASGQTETLELDAPPLAYSLDKNGEEQPYAEYTILTSAPGFETVSIAGAEILPDVTAIQNIRMRPSDSTDSREERFVIPAHTLFGNYPAKIPEQEIKPVNETGEIVLSRVVVPEYIVVHDGSPRDSTAKNYYVKYKDYIKNVASSEIYATWPKSTIRANVLAIMSFTLNRVYTEWYRNQGYDFTITSSTAFDHKWIPERNIYDTISSVVDELFADYLSRPNVRQPILTQYCDGRQVQCPNWMTISQGRIKEFLPYLILFLYHTHNIKSTEMLPGLFKVPGILLFDPDRLARINLIRIGNPVHCGKVLVCGAIPGSNAGQGVSTLNGVILCSASAV